MTQGKCPIQLPAGVDPRSPEAAQLFVGKPACQAEYRTAGGLTMGEMIGTCFGIVLVGTTGVLIFNWVRKNKLAGFIEAAKGKAIALKPSGLPKVEPESQPLEIGSQGVVAELMPADDLYTLRKCLEIKKLQVNSLSGVVKGLINIVESSALKQSDKTRFVDELENLTSLDEPISNRLASALGIDDEDAQAVIESFSISNIFLGTPKVVTEKETPNFDFPGEDSPSDEFSSEEKPEPETSFNFDEIYDIDSTRIEEIADANPMDDIFGTEEQPA